MQLHLDKSDVALSQFKSASDWPDAWLCDDSSASASVARQPYCAIDPLSSASHLWLPKQQNSKLGLLENENVEFDSFDKRMCLGDNKSLSAYSTLSGQALPQSSAALPWQSSDQSHRFSAAYSPLSDHIDASDPPLSDHIDASDPPLSDYINASDPNLLCRCRTLKVKH